MNPLFISSSSSTYTIPKVRCKSSGFCEEFSTWVAARLKDSESELSWDKKGNGLFEFVTGNGVVPTVINTNPMNYPASREETFLSGCVHGNGADCCLQSLCWAARPFEYSIYKNETYWNQCIGKDNTKVILRNNWDRWKLCVGQDTEESEVSKKIQMAYWNVNLPTVRTFHK